SLPLHVAVAAVASRARVSNARTSESAERGHRHQPEEKSQGQESAGCHSHCSLRSARGDARLEKPERDCSPARQGAIPKKRGGRLREPVTQGAIDRGGYSALGLAKPSRSVAGRAAPDSRGNASRERRMGSRALTP